MYERTTSTSFQKRLFNDHKGDDDIIFVLMRILRDERNVNI
jgi:hypothetical protein